jgi:hypothetical protein
VGIHGGEKQRTEEPNALHFREVLPFFGADSPNVRLVEAFFCEYFSTGVDIENIPEFFRFWPVFGQKEPTKLVEHWTFERGLTRAYASCERDGNLFFSS